MTKKPSIRHTSYRQDIYTSHHSVTVICYVVCYVMCNISVDINLIAGSFHFTQLPERVDKEDTGRGKRKELSEDEEEEEKKTNSVKKKRKPRRKRVCEEEEEQARPSSPVTPGQRTRSRKINFCKSLVSPCSLLSGLNIKAEFTHSLMCDMLFVRVG